ncbi:orange carotenoid protein N-terminal domain-containing protein [Gloeobacter kilaueensis]|uniref:OCP N-terminal domain-containing protein n=1 Tax=Gloeobacter kilaueensis (strain ATCC BAA-2537 / CCAP 1431/1 / ULC 316 / JS1) TaxID=1183438 RepID=U5QP49_GLOK1|nr:orange carotenoid protein N-terminal domain-containing protein [Gloeobacter kilaueensis]AGY60673.1 hypothetical protein GKIL_4427 [Gloeobacter kilaueensis JS1]
MDENTKNIDRAFEEGQQLSDPAGSAPHQTSISGAQEAGASSTGAVPAYEQRQVPTNTTDSDSEKVFHEGANQGSGNYSVSSERISDIVDKTLSTQTPGTVRSEGLQQVRDQFDALDVDAKLAVLYYVYVEMGKSVTPAAPAAADRLRVQDFFNGFDALGQGEAQLEAMRALVRGDDTALGQTYGNFTENDKLFTWFLLAERMGKDVIDVPADYKLSEDGNRALEAIKQLDFEQQITLLRDIAYAMGRTSSEYSR